MGAPRKLYGPRGTFIADLTGAVTSVITGLFRIPYDIPATASTGTYTLKVMARYYSRYEIGLKSFLLSSTLTQWNAWLTDIKNDIATIKTDIGTIKGEIIEIKGVGLASIETDVGMIEADVSHLIERTETPKVTINYYILGIGVLALLVVILAFIAVIRRR